MNLLHHDRKQLGKSTLKEKRNIESKELIKCLLRLKYKENLLDKDMQAFINDTNVDPHIKEHLHNITEKCTKRPDDLKELKKNVWIISHDLKSVKSMTDDIESLDADMYKKKLTQLAHKIHSFKESVTLGALSDEQVRLESQVNAMLTKYRIS